jgi:hypothetical protein
MSKYDFYPMLSPREIIEQGAFGGCYFGLPIEEYTNYEYTELFNYHFDGLDTSLYLGETYKPRMNKFKIRSGMPYEYWRDMNWLHEDDPYGWLEWYCKYSMGRRHPDDDRQIRRWQDFCGVNGRWRHNIYKKIHESGDWTIGKRVQQSLLHWGYMVNEEDYMQWKIKNNKAYNEDEWCEYGGLPSPKAYEYDQ